MDLAEAVYAVTKNLPSDERFGLTAQIRRAAVSIPSILAEGQARSTSQDFCRFILISRGSLQELETQLQLALRFGFVTTDELSRANVLIDEVSRLLTRLHQSPDK